MAIETEKGKITVDWSGTYPKIIKPESQPYRQMIMKKQLLVERKGKGSLQWQRLRLTHASGSF